MPGSTVDATAWRCFVAVWPDAAARAQLDALRTSQAQRWPAARPVPLANLHLTLAFIGQLPPARVRALQPAIDQIAVGPFEWTLDRLGVFREARVLWIGGAPATALEQLAARVRSLLDAEAVRYDPKPFVPHVTLLRHCTTKELADSAVAPIAWPVREVRLVVSLSTASGVRYINAAQLLRD